ncbi:hypothetical protein LCGC14_2586680 [marine sediment metagenome]|uniref:Phytanoyl-CoA dioxygenase n=2 Tax=root TaxID=1 RepID=A0A0F9CNZ3_9ZZZZ|nr:MAG: hypothetical protein LCMAC202_05510 [Marseillevirus LCMAC202]
MACKRKYIDIYAADNLHTLGYEVYSDVIPIKDNIVEKLIDYGRNGSQIFNHHETRLRNDHKRRQATLQRRSANLRNGIQDFVSEQFPHLTLKNLVVIHSKPGCGDQASHCDYVPEPNLATVPDSHFPLAVLLAVMPGTKISVWPRSIRFAYTSPTILQQIQPIHRKTLELDIGDMLVFRGDLVHAGAAYDEENVRIHCFLDSELVPRTPNHTWLVHKDSCQELRDIIKSDNH